MAVPKRKMSRSNTRNRRSQWKAKLTEAHQPSASRAARSPVPSPVWRGAYKEGLHRAVRLLVEG